MSWRCDLTGKKPLVGHKVSHSNIKTKRRFMPNLRNVTLISDALGRRVRVRVSANALRTVDHRGGLDAFLLKAKDADLAPKMLDVKRQIVKKQGQGELNVCLSAHSKLVMPGASAGHFLFSRPPARIAAADCAG